jgi:hypothetical protein
MKRAAFLLVVLIVSASMASAQQIYLSSTGSNEIWVANRDGSGSPTVLHSNAGSGTRGPAGMIAVLGSVNQVFYGGGNYSEIDVANVDGSGTPAILWSDGTCCEHLGITADPATGLLYWTTEYETIRSAAWDGTGGITNVFSGLTNGPVGITLDSATGTLYWASVDSDSIYMGAADGSSGPTVVYDGADGVAGPRQIVFSGGMLYWTEHDGGGGGGRIVSAPASGAGPRTVLHAVPAPFVPYGIDIDGSTLVWVEFQPGVWAPPYNDRVMTGAADGSGSPAVLFAGSFGSLRGIAAGANIFFAAAPLIAGIPTLSPWGVMLVIALLAVSAVIVLRRSGTI